MVILIGDRGCDFIGDYSCHKWMFEFRRVEINENRKGRKKKSLEFMELMKGIIKFDGRW